MIPLPFWSTWNVATLLPDGSVIEPLMETPGGVPELVTLIESPFHSVPVIVTETKLPYLSNVAEPLTLFVPSSVPPDTVKGGVEESVSEPSEPLKNVPDRK